MPLRHVRRTRQDEVVSGYDPKMRTGGEACTAADWFIVRDGIAGQSAASVESNEPTRPASYIGVDW